MRVSPDGDVVQMIDALATPTFSIVAVLLGVGLGTLSEAAYKLAWPAAPGEDSKRSKLKDTLAGGAALTAAVGGYALATGGIPASAPFAFATIETAKGFPAAIEVARMKAPKRAKWFRLDYERTLPKRQALTTAVFGLTGLLEVAGFGLASFVPAGLVLTYALSRRFGA